VALNSHAKVHQPDGVILEEDVFKGNVSMAYVMLVQEEDCLQQLVQVAPDTMLIDLRSRSKGKKLAALCVFNNQPRVDVILKASEHLEQVKRRVRLGVQKGEDSDLCLCIFWVTSDSSVFLRMCLPCIRLSAAILVHLAGVHLLHSHLTLFLAIFTPVVEHDLAMDGPAELPHPGKGTSAGKFFVPGQVAEVSQVCVPWIRARAHKLKTHDVALRLCPSYYGVRKRYAFIEKPLHMSWNSDEFGHLGADICNGHI